MIHQVGGNHYSAHYQHWDWAVETELPYLEGCATKYLSRWRKKGGVQDLEKAITYLEKSAQKSVQGAGRRFGLSELKRETFINAAMIDFKEAELIRRIDSWYNSADLDRIIEDIRKLINESS